MRSKFVVAVVALALAGCSGQVYGPLEPSPPPTPPPAQSYARVTQAVPGEGATLNSATESATAIVESGISQADLDEAARTGDKIFARACLSVDGKVPLSSCFYRALSGAYGQTDHLLSAVNPSGGWFVGQTRFIVVELRFRHGSGQQEVERTFASSVFPRTYNWQW